MEKGKILIPNENELKKSGRKHRIHCSSGLAVAVFDILCPVFLTWWPKSPDGQDQIPNFYLEQSMASEGSDLCYHQAEEFIEACMKESLET